MMKKRYYQIGLIYMIKIDINNEIFDKAVIDQAIADYKELAEVSYEETHKAWTCKFLRCKYDEGLTAREFENHLVDLMNCRGL